MTYIYFISYDWVTELQRGSGNQIYYMRRSINSVKDLRIIQEFLNTQKDSSGNNFRCIIKNYILIKKSRY